MQSLEYIVKIDKQDRDFVNRVLEVFEDVAVMRTIKRFDETQQILTNEYNCELLEELIEYISNYGINISVISKGKWEGRI